MTNVCFGINKNVSDMFEKTICMGYVHMDMLEAFSRENII